MTLRPAEGANPEAPYWRLPGYVHVEAPPVSILERGFRMQNVRFDVRT